MTDSLNVLYEDNHCLAVDKPAGLLTMGDHTGEPTLVDAAREYLADVGYDPDFGARPLKRSIQKEVLLLL